MQWQYAVKFIQQPRCNNMQFCCTCVSISRSFINTCVHTHYVRNWQLRKIEMLTSAINIIALRNEIFVIITMCALRLTFKGKNTLGESTKKKLRNHFFFC